MPAVRLVDYGLQKIQVILVLRRTYGISLVDANSILGKAPVDLPPLAQAAAAALKGELDSAGAKTEIVPGPATMACPCCAGAGKAPPCPVCNGSGYDPRQIMSPDGASVLLIAPGPCPECRGHKIEIVTPRPGPARVVVFRSDP